MSRRWRNLQMTLNRLTLYAFALAGIVAAVVGTFTDVRWVSDNLTGILLFELSTLLAFLATEFGTLTSSVDQLHAKTAELRTIDEPEPLYRMAVTALVESFETPHVNKSVWIVSATGVPNARPANAMTGSAIRAYYDALQRVIERPGWSVRILYNIESVDRLEWVHNYLSTHPNATDLEARAMTRVTREIIAPLIVGDDCVIFAQGDRRFHSVKSGIAIKDPSATLFARTYFESLWQSTDLKVIRRATGVDETAFSSIRHELTT